MTNQTGVQMPDFDPSTYKTGDRYEGDWQPTAECGWAGARTSDYGAAKAELADHVRTAHAAQWTVAAEFYSHAEANYNGGGWDVIVETYTVAEIAETFAAEGIGTLPAALASSTLAACTDVWADRQADARNSAF